MTAEIVVMNIEAVALAADSAVSFRAGDNEKVSTSANKLFALSKHCPVGIMVYGNATFMDIPWETIIKVYRTSRLPTGGFSTLDEYGRDLLAFLDADSLDLHDAAEENYVASFVLSRLNLIREDIRNDIDAALEESKDLAEDPIGQIVQNVISRHLEESANSEAPPLVPIRLARKVLRENRRGINEAIDGVLEPYGLSAGSRGMLWKILEHAFAKSIPEDSHAVCSGIVVAGFGQEDMRPSVQSFLVEGIIRGKLKYKSDPERSLSKNVRAGVVPFAQGEMVHRFMSGVDPLYRYTEETYLRGLCEDYAAKVVRRLRKYSKVQKERIRVQLVEYGNVLVQEFVGRMNEFAEEQFSAPTVTSVSRLSKNELAAMAEALVYLIPSCIQDDSIV